jgi:hypothetical protein
MSDADELARTLSGVAGQLAAAMLAADDEASRLIGAASAPLTPRRTGDLAASARFGGGTVTYTSDHAVPVFGGTATMAARPWVLTAAYSSEADWMAAYVAAAEKALDTIRT